MEWYLLIERAASLRGCQVVALVVVVSVAVDAQVELTVVLENVQCYPQIIAVEFSHSKNGRRYG